MTKTLTLSADLEEILRTLNILYEPDDIAELRVIRKGRKQVAAGYYDRAHWGELAKAAAENNVDSNIYVGMNRINPQLLGRYCNRLQTPADLTTGDTDIKRRRWVLIDCDPMRPANTSSTEEQLQASEMVADKIREHLSKLNFPEPFIAMSGNGYHLLYPIDAPNSEEVRDLIQRFLKWLDEVFGNEAVSIDTNVYNAARITKLYGTIARKGDSTKTTPHRRSYIVSEPSTKKLLDLDILKSILPPAEHLTRQKAPNNTGMPGKAIDPAVFLDRYGLEYITEPYQGGIRYKLAVCPFNPEHTHGEAAVLQLPSGALAFNCFHNSCSDKGWSEFREHFEGPRKQFSPQTFTDLKPDVEERKPLFISDSERACTEVGEAEAPRVRVIDALDFMSMQFPPRENILSPWLPNQGLVMIYGPRGTGKTHGSLGIAYAVSSGGTLWGWMAPKPTGVLFIDGEMPAGVLQQRLARIAVSSESDLGAPLRIVTPDLQPSGMIDLSNPEDQKVLTPYLDGIGLIIVDNLSTLCRRGKESEGESWLPVQEWALQQRAAGRSILFIHHAGKNGEQRGTSRREDVLDTVIALKRPGDYTPDKGACFEIHFEKARGIYGDDTKPFEAQLVTTPDGRQEWVTKPLEQSTAEKVASLLNDGIPQTEIPDLLGLSKGAVSKAKKRAIEEGLLKVA